jgi:hypothetical protein
MSAPISAIPFGHILCWVDGSDEACRAAERAAHLAKSLGAKLSFLALGDEPGYSKGFEDYAQIEGVIGPMSPSIANNVEACLFQAVSVAADTRLYTGLFGLVDRNAGLAHRRGRPGAIFLSVGANVLADAHCFGRYGSDLRDPFTCHRSPQPLFIRRNTQ